MTITFKRVTFTLLERFKLVSVNVPCHSDDLSLSLAFQLVTSALHQTTLRASFNLGLQLIDDFGGIDAVTSPFALGVDTLYFFVR